VWCRSSLFTYWAWLVLSVFDCIGSLRLPLDTVDHSVMFSSVALLRWVCHLILIASMGLFCCLLSILALSVCAWDSVFDLFCYCGYSDVFHSCCAFGTTDTVCVILDRLSSVIYLFVSMFYGLLRLFRVDCRSEIDGSIGRCM